MTEEQACKAHDARMRLRSVVWQLTILSTEFSVFTDEQRRELFRLSNRAADVMEGKRATA